MWNLSSNWTLRCPSTSGRASATVERVMGAEGGMLVRVAMRSIHNHSKVGRIVWGRDIELCGYARNRKTYEERRLENVVAVRDHSE